MGLYYYKHKGKIIEVGKPTHFGTAFGTLSAIDLTFTTPSLAPRLTWDILSHTYRSYHLPIIINLTYRNTEDIQVSKSK
jgi:hypothetical protein